MTTALTLQPDADLAQYVEEVSKLPVLSRDEELDLARRYARDGDVTAAHALVVSNLRFVVKIANEYRGYGMKLLDLIQEGNIGLMKAVKKFDPERGYRLISYAVWWIRAQIQAFVVRSWSLVKIGSGHTSRKLFFKLRSEKSKAEQAAEGKLSRAELAQRLDVDESEIDEMDMRLAARDFSLDAPRGDDGAYTAADMLANATDVDQETVAAQNEEQRLLADVLERTEGKLNEKERFILEHRLLADEPMTLAEVCEHYGVTRERARQIENGLLKKFRKALPQAQRAQLKSPSAVAP